MAEPVSSETTSLLGADIQNGNGTNNHPQNPPCIERTPNWFAEHAVIISVSSLIVAVFIIICTYIGAYSVHKTPSSKTTVCMSAA